MFSVSSIQKKYGRMVDSLDFWLLLTHSTKQPKEWLLAHSEFEMSLYTYCTFRYHLWQRKRGVPLAYITGHKEFFGIDFLVNIHTLIPRPDTEILVENVIGEIKKQGNKEIMMIDVGTGSGCIPISIMKTLEHKNTRLQRYAQHCGQVKTFAIDISEKALRVAKENARIQNVFIEFFRGNLLEPILEKSVAKKNERIIITANLPYLTQEQFDAEPSIQHEPISALVADKLGLGIYETLLQQLRQLPTPLYATLFFEIDPSQTHAILDLIQVYLPNSDVRVIKDLGGHDRVVRIHV